MKKINLSSPRWLAALALAVAALITTPSAQAQNIVWGTATGISGDANLINTGTYFDAFLTNSTASSSITADGVLFNAASPATSGLTATDGIISFAITSGANQQYSFTTFSTYVPSASSGFAAVMNSGGTYQNGGAGAGVVTIADLTVGDSYSVQVFNFADDGDAGLTTLSGSNAVTLSNLPAAGGTGTAGEFATGDFTATSATETFAWNGAGSSYTVLGAISVQQITAAVPEPSTYALMLAGLLMLGFFSLRRRNSSVV